MDWIDSVIQDVAELDYNSPVDQPSVMLVKAGELRAILEARSGVDAELLQHALDSLEHYREQTRPDWPLRFRDFNAARTSWGLTSAERRDQRRAEPSRIT